MKHDPWEMEERGRRVNTGLRLAGFAVIVLAFLGVSQSFTSGKKKGSGTTPTSTTSTTPSRPAVVYADAALEPVLRQIAPSATYTFGTADELAAKIGAGAPVDVFLSASKTAMSMLQNADRCSTPVAFATKPLYSSCDVQRAGADAVVSGTYVDSLTTITAREVLLGAGIDIPQSR